jgi:(S)-sulfolactate dehydrogenase
MAIAAYDPFLPEADPAWAGVTRHATVDDLLAASDAVSLHVPLTPETRGLIDGRRIALMKPGAVLVNTARGGIVDESALAEALRDGRLGGAALDVFEAEEPLKAGSPLAGAPNLIATPHIAGVTRESNTRISWITVENVAKALETAR